MNSGRKHFLLLSCIGFLALTACGGGGAYGGSSGGSGGGSSGYSISITPTSSTIAVSATQQYTASTTGGLSNLVWKSSNTSVATINSNGLATAVATGTATISATAQYTYNSTVYTVHSNQATLTVSASGMATGVVKSTQLWAGALVTLKDAANQSVTAVTDSNGRYILSVVGLASPFIVEASDGQGHAMFSMGNGEGVINIDSVSDIMTRLWYRSHATTADAAFSAPAAHPAADAASLRRFNSTLSNALAAPLSARGLSAAAVDFIATPFSANDAGLGNLLAATHVDLQHQQLTVFDAAGSSSSHVNFQTGKRSVAIQLTVPQPEAPNKVNFDR